MAATRPLSLRVWKAVWTLLGLVTAVAMVALSSPAIAGAENVKSNARGALDCNGDSPTQQPTRPTMNCTDIRGFNTEWNANTWGGRFYDNGQYIGHDEPDTTFLSHQPGSANDVTWTMRIGQDPAAAPTDVSPGHDVSHYFQLTPAPWFSMAICDNNSYPQASCTPDSDANAPAPSCETANPCTGNQGGGSAFMEMQLYPPGFGPFVDGISCDNKHWCAALTIDSLECTEGFAICNGNCEEPVNFAFIQRDGVPAGPPSPQKADLDTDTQNRQTLLMDPGDVIQVHMFDAPVAGHRGQRAFEVVIYDLTTHQSGWMQASAANGFQNTNIDTCDGTPYNFEPEYNTAAKDNIVPWAALQTNISTEFETGHWESCQSLSEPQPLEFNNFVSTDPFNGTVIDTTYNRCSGPYENAAGGEDSGNNPEVGDAPCYQQGDTHGALNSAPDVTTGCTDELYENGDLDFDGSPYWPEWPTGSQPTHSLPGSFVEALPTTGGRQYRAFFMQTDIALSESSCSGTTTAGCTVPPAGPGDFYPYWSRVTSPQFGRGSHGSGNATCTLEFGNVSSGPGVNDFGGDAEYGTDQIATLGYPEFEGPVMSNRCGSHGQY
jgi:hypothetical protein